MHQGAGQRGDRRKQERRRYHRPKENRALAGGAAGARVSGTQGCRSVARAEAAGDLVPVHHIPPSVEGGELLLRPSPYGLV